MYKLSLSQMVTKCELYNAVTVNTAGRLSLLTK